MANGFGFSNPDALDALISRFDPQNFGVVSSTSLADVGRFGAQQAFGQALPDLMRQRGQRQQQEALAQTQSGIKQQELTRSPVSDLLRTLMGGGGLGAISTAGTPAAPIVSRPSVGIGNLPSGGGGGGGGVGGGGVPGGAPGGIDFGSFRGLLDQILQPLLAQLAPAEGAARQRLEDAFRLAGGGSGPGSLQGPLLESIRRQEEGFARERGGVGAQAALGVLQPFLGAGVATRGQDITAGTATRGQDIESLIAQLSAGVTQRGQDITQELGRQIPPGAPLSAQTALLQTLLSQIL